VKTSVIATHHPFKNLSNPLKLISGKFGGVGIWTTWPNFCIGCARTTEKPK